VDTCTVTALGAITALAVPNPNGHLATPSVFSGLVVPQVALLNQSPSLLWTSYCLGCQPFSAVDVSHLTGAGAIVNARGWCNLQLFQFVIIRQQATEIKQVAKSDEDSLLAIHTFSTEVKLLHHPPGSREELCWC